MEPIKEKSLKILFLYPNLTMSALVPYAISILSAVLKKDGFKNIDLFDATFYKPLEESKDERGVRLGQVKPFDFKERNVIIKTTDMYKDFVLKVEEMKPDLIAASIVEDTYPIFLQFMSAIKEKKILTVVGGPFPTNATEMIALSDYVDFICKGDGEGAMLDLCNALEQGKEPTSIPNLIIKKNGAVTERNPVRDAQGLNELPMQDLSIFEPNSLYRPMMGKIYRFAPLEPQRGCPYLCTFCNSPENNTIYKDDSAGDFLRDRTIKNLHEEIEHLVKNFGIEYFFMVTDTFLAMSNKRFDEFCEMYSNFKLPFFMNTRPETITEYRAKKLKEINCHRVNIGVEHGNEKFRAEVIKRKCSNDTIVRAFEIMHNAGISTALNNIIGYPDETRELIFDTIELSRKIKSSGINAYIFAPYKGTQLRNLCETKGYIDSETLAHIYTKDSILKMPSLTKEEIRGLSKTFVFYARLPKSYWGEIELAERDTDEGLNKHSELLSLYQSIFLSLREQESNLV